MIDEPKRCAVAASTSYETVRPPASGRFGTKAAMKSSRSAKARSGTTISRSGIAEQDRVVMTDETGLHRQAVQSYERFRLMVGDEADVRDAQHVLGDIPYRFFRRHPVEVVEPREVHGAPRIRTQRAF